MYRFTIPKNFDKEVFLSFTFGGVSGMILFLLSIVKRFGMVLKFYDN